MFLGLGGHTPAPMLQTPPAERSCECRKPTAFWRFRRMPFADSVPATTRLTPSYILAFSRCL